MNEENNKNFENLFLKLEDLIKKQETFSQEINQLKNEIKSFQLKENTKTSDLSLLKKEKELEQEEIKITQNASKEFSKLVVSELQKPKVYPSNLNSIKVKSDIEKFIGENLINKIGILILIIGVGIGAKYSIENELISPLTRIILGYILGTTLLGFGIKLKIKYENFSAVLVSGSIAIMYFLTFAAYDFYELIPQSIAFVLMLIFTIFTIIASLNYNRQVIAHIGFVGAYAVPFLLSDGSGNIQILFSYMTIINIGILILSFKKNWKPLYFHSFFMTWIIYLIWYVDNDLTEKFNIAFGFAFIFFIIFYIKFLAYKLLKQQKFSIEDVIMVMLNSFIFYGVGFGLLSNNQTYENYLGIYTLANAIIHFAISIVIYKKNLADKNIFFLIVGMVLIFITIAVPVQLDGNWITFAWISIATLLFWIGRTKKIPFYENTSYLLICLAGFSLVLDWEDDYQVGFDYTTKIELFPILNIQFFTSVFFLVALGIIYYFHKSKNYKENIPKNNLVSLFSIVLPCSLITIIYLMFALEISHYFNISYHNSYLEIKGKNESFETILNEDLLNFKSIWLINYSLFFISILSLVNNYKIKNSVLASFTLVASVLGVFIFLTNGLYELSELRENYINQYNGKYYNIGFFNITIRYISYLFVTFLIYVVYKTIKQEFVKQNYKVLFNILLHTTILWILSSELITILDLSDSDQSYKLGLSILWGIYSLMLVILGIWKNQKFIRIGGFIVFALTLLKLFFYDISDLNTIAKTIVFVSLGILLLISSFLYNKYKYLIQDEPTNQ
jgi:uncharacterized membrane protein